MFDEDKVLFALVEGVGGERDKTRVWKSRLLPWTTALSTTFRWTHGVLR